MLFCFLQTKLEAQKQTRLSTRTELLDPRGKYRLNWNVNEENKTIIFEVIVETKGWIGLGFSKNKSIVGADFFIGGVNSEENPYFEVKIYWQATWF